MFAAKTIQFLLYRLLTDQHINSMSTTRERRQPNPSSRLTAAFNAARPALSSHRESVAQAQRARVQAAAEAESVFTTVEAQNAPLTAPLTTPNVTIVPPDPGNDFLDLDDPLISGSLLTTPTTSQAGSIPPLTDPPSESEDSDQPPSVTRKNKRKRRKSSGSILPIIIFAGLILFHI
jgi:hypothetical protein